MVDMDDDLDAFFDEVEEVEEEVKKQIGKDQVATEPLSTTTTTSAAAVSASAGEKDHEENEQAPPAEAPPTKKARILANDSSPVPTAVPTAVPTMASRKAAIVASSGPTTNILASASLAAAISAPPLPPQPPLPNTTPPSSSQSHSQPPLPPRIQPILTSVSTTTSSAAAAATATTSTTSTLPIPPNTNTKQTKRSAAGKTWTDKTLLDFPANDFRLFVGNLAKDITDAKLAEAFSSKYPSFAMARVVYDANAQTSKGFGFVSLMDYRDCARAMREMDQSWLGSRPIRVKRSEWKERDLGVVRKRNRKKGGRR